MYVCLYIFIYIYSDIISGIYIDRHICRDFFYVHAASNWQSVSAGPRLQLVSVGVQRSDAYLLLPVSTGSFIKLINVRHAESTSLTPFLGLMSPT